MRADESELMCHKYRNKSCTSNKNISNSIGFVVFGFCNSLQQEKKIIQFTVQLTLFYQQLVGFQSHANNSIPVLFFFSFFFVFHTQHTMCMYCVVNSFNKHIPIFFFLVVVIYCDCMIFERIMHFM